MLLNRGASRIDKDELLRHACSQGSLEIAELLIEGGASLLQSNLSGSTPLHLACLHGHVELATMLLNRGAAVSNMGIVRVMSASNGVEQVRNEQFKAIWDFVQQSSDRQLSREHDEYSPLYYATVTGHAMMVKYLLDNGANVDEALRNGSTPLHLACLHGHVELARMLLNRGADDHLKDWHGFLPFDFLGGTGRPLVEEPMHSDGQ